MRKATDARELMTDYAVVVSIVFGFAAAVALFWPAQAEAAVRSTIDSRPHLKWHQEQTCRRQ